MGNESSVPSPENDGLQPPSQIPPQASADTANESRGSGKALSKVVKAALQRNTSGDKHYSHTQQNQQQKYNYNKQQVTAESDRNNLSHIKTHNQKSKHARKPSLDHTQAIPVMYASEGGANTRNNQNNTSSSTTATAKAVRNGGRALINSMRNLTVATGNLKSTGLPRKPDPVQREENEWESRWDEDDDDSDGEEEQEDSQTEHLPTPMPPQKMSSTTPVDLLAAPDSTTESKQNETYSQKLDGNLLLQNEKKVPAYEKPNVQMFLPLLRVLGKGSFGKVVLVQKRTGIESGTMFAMKILRKTHLMKRRQIERTRTERKVLSVVDHPFIMKLHYAFQTEDKLYLVLDYCPGGELFFHLSRFRRFPERVAKFYSAELLLAIGHLHKRGIIYRDLKPENVLLDADGHVKLGDFGLAKSGIRHPYQGATSMCGTPEYMAPEVLGQQGHGFCVDYWGLGMLTYEMMTGLPPWYTTDRQKLFRRLKAAQLEIPSFFSVQAAACVSQLLQRDPTRRLGVTGIRTAMEHEFFRTINWRALYARRIDAPIRPCDGWNNERSFYSTGDDALDAATANFDNQFTRMKVDTDESPQDNGGHNDVDEKTSEELHANTFVGFTYDEAMGDIPPYAGAQRQRNHHYKNSTN